MTDTTGDPDHPKTAAHVRACRPCRGTLRSRCERRDHRRCHMHPTLRCKVSARWLEPVVAAAREAVAASGEREAWVVVSIPAGLEGEPTVHGVTTERREFRRLYTNASARLGVRGLASHGRVFMVNLWEQPEMPLR